MTNDASLGWDQFTIFVDEADASLVSDALIEMGALGLHIEDDSTLSVPEKSSSDTKRSCIIASFNASVGTALKTQSAINALFEELKITDSASCSFEHIPQQDYAKQFEQNWKSFPIGEKIWIVPSWEQDIFVCDDKEAIVIHMDPELAFGTGQHETTRLCSEAILRSVRDCANPQSLSILDVGTGTGILAFVGLLAGARRAVLTDIDPEALTVARANAQKNNLLEKVYFSSKNPNELGEQFEIVVANILALPLIELASNIVAAIKPKGLLLLSGLLTNQVEKVAEAYKALGMVVLNVETMNEWALVSLRLP